MVLGTTVRLPEKSANVMSDPDNESNWLTTWLDRNEGCEQAS